MTLPEIHLLQMMVGFFGSPECSLGIILMRGIWEAEDAQEGAPLSKGQRQGVKKQSTKGTIVDL